MYWLGLQQVAASLVHTVFLYTGQTYLLLVHGDFHVQSFL